MTTLILGGIETQLDDEDVSRVSANRWWTANGYLERHLPGEGGKRQRLSRFLLDYDGPLMVDHIDRNINNNQKSNLRLVNKAENALNAKRRSDNTSGHKGVSWHKAMQKWRAYIILNKKEKHLGFYANLEDAVKARLTAEALNDIIS